jgi:hypothetical protein
LPGRFFVAFEMEFSLDKVAPVRISRYGFSWSGTAQEGAARLKDFAATL